MKNLVIILFLSTGLTAHAQNILRVNNIPGINAPYITIQDAVAAASAGDIILVEGSPFVYNVGNLSLTKRLTIKGPGYFLGENTSLQASQNPATINGNYFYFSSGSEGSMVSGLTFAIDQLHVKTSSITISNNRVTGNLGIQVTNPATASNLLISGNYIEPNPNRSIYFNGQTITNVVIINNYLSIRISNEGGSVFGSIKNNIIGYRDNHVSNCEVVNNIFLYNDNYAALFLNAVNATIHHNVFVRASLPEVDGTNVLGASVAALFIGLSGNTTDTQWKLKAGSPAIGVGDGGVDCGIYGHITPYKPSGIQTGQPTITNFTTPGSVPANGILNMKVSAKVN